MSILTSLQQSIQWLTNNLNTLRRGSIVTACITFLITSVALYFAAFRDAPERDFWPLFKGSPHTTYDLYSGPPEGRFAELGACLQKQSSTEESSFSLISQNTRGSIDNAQRLATTRRAFGFVGEQGGFKSFITQRIQLVTPVYMQKAQVLYRVKSFERAGGSGVLRFAHELDDAALKFMSDARMDVGPAGSGTQLVASYLLRSLSLKPKTIGSSADFGEQLRKLTADDTDIVFLFAGTLKVVEDALKNSSEIGVASIDPAIAAMLSKEYGVDITSTTHSELNRPNLNTLGSFAWLAASADVPTGVIAQFSERLASCEPVAAAQLERVVAGLKLREGTERRQLVSSFVQFVIGGVTLTAVFQVVMAFAFSARKRARFVARYMELRKESQGLRATMCDAQTKPRDVLRQLQAHDDALLTCLQDIEVSFQNGEILLSHRDRVVAAFESIRADLHVACAYAIQQLSNRETAERTLSSAEEWLARGYLQLADYDRLQQRLTPREPVSTTHSKPGAREA